MNDAPIPAREICRRAAAEHRLVADTILRAIEADPQSMRSETEVAMRLIAAEEQQRADEWDRLAQIV
jgi:hypothetical protein